MPIIPDGLYIVYSIFHSSLYCRAVYLRRQVNTSWFLFLQSAFIRSQQKPHLHCCTLVRTLGLLFRLQKKIGHCFYHTNEKAWNFCWWNLASFVLEMNLGNWLRCRCGLIKTGSWPWCPNGMTGELSKKKKRVVTIRFVIWCYVNIENNFKQFEFCSDSKHSKIFISQEGIIHYIDTESRGYKNGKTSIIDFLY